MKICNVFILESSNDGSKQSFPKRNTLLGELRPKCRLPTVFIVIVVKRFSKKFKTNDK